MTNDNEWLAGRFEEHRARLRAVAWRLLGSLSEADDAVQEAWLRASRSSGDDVDNLAGWLTTIVSRVDLNTLRDRKARREQAFGVRLPDPVVSPDGELGPEEEVLLADSIGLALLVVLNSLSPAERVAFVLHDVFQLVRSHCRASTIATLAERVGQAATSTITGVPSRNQDVNSCLTVVSVGGRRSRPEFSWDALPVASRRCPHREPIACGGTRQSVVVDNRARQAAAQLPHRGQMDGVK